MDAPETVTDAMALLEREGFDSNFSFDDDGLVCAACGGPHTADQVVVRHTFRFEGDSDPGDEAIVLGVECPATGAKGIVVSAYGPDADPQLIQLLRSLG
jgi:hypothetical protein